MHLQGW
ncbi:hypothetical protein LINGRAHAP2_LOCUS443 [Linum grandiflorum]